MKTKPTFKLQNFYEKKEVQAFMKKQINPNKKYHGLDLPMRLLVIGSSGSGKTCTTLNLLNYFSHTFNTIYLIAKTLNEPLYDYLQFKMKKQNVHFFEGLDDLNSWDLKEHFEGKGQCLIIFDDLMLEKKQDKILELFIKGRKLASGVSLVYLAQGYFPVHKDIRGNCTNLILRKVPNKRDLVHILKNSSLGIEPDELLKIYNYCVKDDITSFLSIDLKAPPETAFKKNFIEPLY
jgi:hypothetical protein